MKYRITNLLWMALLAICAFGLYLVKYTVQDMQREVVALRDQDKKEHESLHLLNAEWAYLNRPERLRQLSDRHLDLSPLDSRRIQEIAVLPAAYQPDTNSENSQPIPASKALYQPAGGR